MNWPAPPGNANAPLAKGRRENLTGQAEDKSGCSFAQVRHQPCTHPVTRTERFPGGVPHYSHEVCAMCGRHVRWFPKSATIERRRLNALRLARLGMCSTLSPWERQFVRDVSQQRKLSPKQSALVERLAVQHLEAKAP